MMQQLVDTYQCEWAAVVRDPEKRRRFRQFVNTDETESCIEIVTERGQSRPADWPSEFVSLEQFRMLDGRSLGEHERAAEPLRWVRGRLRRPTFRTTAARPSSTASRRSRSSTSPAAASGTPARTCARTRRRSCCRAASSATPASEPKVACPLHKKTFSLEIGRIAAGRGVSHPDVSA